MKATWSLFLRIAVFPIILISAGNSLAQAPLEPAQMSANTAFYVVWRGLPPVEARKANSLFALWDDPDFAPARAAMMDNFLKDSNNKANVSREELNEELTLLENPLVIGYLSKPKNTPAGESGHGASSDKAAKWDGGFLVYDRTGKESLLSKTVLRMRAREKESPQVSEVTVGGIKAQKIQRTSGVSYWVENGKYAVAASERSVLETVLARLAAKTELRDSLAEVAAYREAKPLLGGGLVEVFANISGVAGLADESSVSGVKVAPLLGSLKLDAIHSLAGRVVLEGTKTHLQGALLGDTSAGTLFELWGDGQASPALLSYLPLGAISFSSSQINFMGIYALIKRVVHATFPQTQQGNADMVDLIAQSKLGMPVPQMLGDFSGEFASVQTDPRLDSSKQVYLLGIRDKAEVLKLIHTVATDNIVSEKGEGGADYLKLSLSNNKSGAANIEKNSWRMAVTDDAVLFGSTSDALHKAIAERGARGSAGKAALPERFTAMRSKYPEKLNSISFWDFQKVDWAGAKAHWIEESQKTAAKGLAAKPGAASITAPSWLSQADPKVFAQHLHFASGASWKDATGIHFEEWIE
jgi:hypothetical protein